jgi:hypothetical protein
MGGLTCCASLWSTIWYPPHPLNPAGDLNYNLYGGELALNYTAYEKSQAHINNTNLTFWKELLSDQTKHLREKVKAEADKQQQQQQQQRRRPTRGKGE